MITPSPAEIIVIRAACAKRFGNVPAILVPLEHPIDAAVVVAAFDLATYSAHIDARQGNAVIAANNLPVERLLWCSPVPYAAADQVARAPWYWPLVLAGDLATIEPPERDADPLRTVAAARLEALREAWPATCGMVESEMRLAAGGSLEQHPAQLLTASNAPKGFALPADAPERGPGALWLASWGAGADYLPIVMRQPLPDVWTAGKAIWNAAVAKGDGLVAASMRFAAELVVWAPEPPAQLWERLPAVAFGLRDPFLATGGHGADSSWRFL